MADNTKPAAHNAGELKQLNKHSLLTHVTHYSCIFVVTTIVNSNAIMGAVSQACLTPIADHIIVMDGTTALTIESFCRFGSGITKLTAHHMGISNIPTVITHSAPFSTVVDLHASPVGTATSYQSEVTLFGKRETTTVYYKLNG